MKSFKKINKFCLIFVFLLFCNAYAIDNLTKIDNLRAELSTCEKTSPKYLKTKKKLDKLIVKINMDYSDSARLSDATRLIQEQKFESALYELNSLIEKEYELSKCYELMGDIFLTSKADFNSAVNFYQKAIDNNSSNAMASYKLAKLNLKQDKTLEGIMLAQNAVNSTNDVQLLNDIENMLINEVNPKNKYESNNLYDILGGIYLKLDKKQDAYKAYSVALQFNPEDIDLMYRLGRILYNDNQNNSAIDIFDLILNKMPNDTQIRLSKAQTLQKGGNILSANKEYQKILEEYPQSNQAKYGIYLLYEDKIPTEKIIQKMFVEQNGKPTSNQLNQFRNYLNSIKDVKALKAIDDYINGVSAKHNLIQKQQPAQVQTKKEEQKTPQKKTQNIKKENIKETKKVIQPQISKEKKSQNIQGNYSKELDKEAKLAINPKNQEIINNYLKIKPKTVQIYTAIANTYKSIKLPYHALKYFDEAKKIDPANSDVYYNIGLIYMELNQTQEAKKNLEKSINLDSNNKKAYTLLKFVNQKLITDVVNKAYSEFEKKDYIKASIILDDGIKKYPNSANIYYYRALVYDAMNRNAACIIDLQKAIELDGSYYMAYYQLGKTYEKINDDKSALVAYERFLSAEPQDKDLENIIKEVENKVLVLSKKYY